MTENHENHENLDFDWNVKNPKTKQIFNWDITFRLPNEKYTTWKDLNRKARKYFKKYSFSHEQGDKEEKDHYQFRGSLFKKATKKDLKDKLLPIFGGFWTPTSNENVGNYAYVKKEDTHIAGPWDQDTPCNDEPRMLPDVQEFMDLGMLPWHTRALEYCQTKNDFRKIMVVVDKKGEHGKNSFKRWLRYKEYANDVPATIDTAQKIMEFVFNNEELGCFTFNFPRAMKLDGHQGRQLAIAIEALKDGDVYDTRYSGRSHPIPRPQVLVLCNEFFNLDWLTLKRYIFIVLDDEVENGYIEMNSEEFRSWQNPENEDEPENGAPDKVGSYQKVAQKAQKAVFPIKKKKVEKKIAKKG